MKEAMKLSDNDKRVLRQALKETNNLPPAQGQVVLNISPEGNIGSVEIKIMKK
jgi:hypothetical protein